MTPSKRQRRPSGTINSNDLLDALRMCFDQSATRGLSIAEFMEINEHNRKLTQENRPKRECAS